MIDQHGDFNIFNDAYKSKIISLCQQSHDGNTTLYIQSKWEKGHRMNIWNAHLSTSNSSYFCYYSKIDVRVFCRSHANKHQSLLEWHTPQPVYWLLLLLPASQLMSAEWVTLVDSVNESESCKSIIGWKKRAWTPLISEKHICRSNYVICCWGFFDWKP